MKFKSLFVVDRQPGMELLIELNVLPIFGPMKRTTAITTRATSERMIAYSTRPCPFCVGAKNIKYSFQKNFPFPEYLLRVIRRFFHNCIKTAIPKLHIKKEALSSRQGFSLLVGAGYGRELEMVLKVLPILGPSKRMTAITTIATRARMIAYSTRPWPFSLGANNMVLFPF
jgi:hypothetical protein